MPSPADAAPFAFVVRRATAAVRPTPLPSARAQPSHEAWMNTLGHACPFHVAGKLFARLFSGDASE